MEDYPHCSACVGRLQILCEREVQQAAERSKAQDELINKVNAPDLIEVLLLQKVEGEQTIIDRQIRRGCEWPRETISRILNTAGR